ncbi:MAG: 6-phosphogluconolactonase, partial [Ilumatobacteraceae bacterium]
MGAAQPPPQRLTLGYPVLVAAREVWVLASGTGKTAGFTLPMLEKLR